MGFFSWLLGRGGSESVVRAETRRSVSLPGESMGLSDMFGGYVGLAGDSSFSMMKVYRYLRDVIPDVSDAVWTWKRLCAVGYDVEILGESSELARRRARRVIGELDRRVNGDCGGMDGLLDGFYTSLFTYGAGAFELVLSRDRKSIWDIVPVDVWTVRFKRDEKTGCVEPYQVLNGEEVKLNPELFIYVGLDRDGTNPYGRSMLSTIPLVVKIQQRLMADMSKAMHNAGWPKMHVKYSPGDKFGRESQDAYKERVRGNFDSLKESVGKLEADQNIVTLDNVSVEEVSGSRQGQAFAQTHRAVEEQMITGMHLMPILMGRNYGTTETYGTAQYEIINRHVNSVNRSVKRFLERIYNYELGFMWGEARARVRMKNARTVDVLKEAQAEGRRLDTVLRMRDEGLIGEEEAVAMLKVGGRA
ncbi:hypothetical protein ACFL1X_08950 [Candidatus Hydrogenedentota bacterium]